jgi:UDP-glucose 4-epimerase
MDSVRLHRQRIDWSDPESSLNDLGVGLKRWLNDPDAERFELYWSAGVTVVSSNAEQSLAEEVVFARFLDLLRPALARCSQRVSIFLASSAGGVYAGGRNAPFCESSVPVPVTNYGRAKLSMEQRLSACVTDNVTVLVGRISNLYGPAQRIEKAQGFISHLCKSMVTREPMSVYVPLDTMRDFIHADDAAHVIVAGMQLLSSEEHPHGSAVVKNICSGRSTTLGHILHEARLAFKRQPAIVVAPTWRAEGQVLDLRISSEVWPELDRLPRRSLLVGLAQTRANMERQMMSRGYQSV